MHYDVFNGDADGILSLLQLRLAEPKSSVLVTGVKRDIGLLIQVADKLETQRPSSVTVLDISMEKNRKALDKLLENQVPVCYFDHHRSGVIPGEPLLESHINTDANVCTALLVNEYLGQRYLLWAIAAAFGDNLIAVGEQMSDAAGLDEQLTAHLRQLGTCINYNGYGRTVEDLHFPPAQLFNQLLAFESPVQLINDESSVYYDLQRAYEQDMSKAKSAEVVFVDGYCKVVLLPDEAWSHRISGVYGNELANSSPDLAHAVLTINADGQSYTVSVRAPLNNKQGAGDLCSQFETGGGRAAAAGINSLPMSAIDTFFKRLSSQYSKG